MQYFATLHTGRETRNTKNALTLTFIRENKHRSTIRQRLRQDIKTFVE